jgi:hypothetical protein
MLTTLARTWRQSRATKEMLPEDEADTWERKPIPDRHVTFILDLFTWSLAAN